MKYFDVFRCYCTKAKEIQSPSNPLVSKRQVFFKMFCLKTWKGHASNHLDFVYAL